MDKRVDEAMSTADREIVLARVYDAPRELVWQAMTDPKHVVNWWGPNGFTTTIEKMDVRPGGVWKHVMHGPDGTDYPNSCVFKEVVKPERIIYSHGGGKQGGRGTHFTATWTFETLDGDKTKVTIRMVFDTPADRDFVINEYGAIEGGKQTLGRLAEYLAQGPIVIERVLDAPAETVWKAITELDQMRQWYFAQLESFAPEVGFQTQFNVHHDGKNFPHIWKVTDVVPGRKIAYSWKYGGFPGESLVTFELFAEGKKTRLKLTHAGLETFQPESHPDLARKNFVAGWTSLAAKLQQFVESSDDALVIVRIVDASRELVWKAWTEPEHLMRWWAPKGCTTPFCKVDLRPGGKFHYCMRLPEGRDIWGMGVYREIVAPARLVYADSFADAQGNPVPPAHYGMSASHPAESLVTVTFEEHAGKTRVTLRHAIAVAVEERKGAEQGWGEMLDRLAETLANA
jgi:uncharacterized protein YndB with AHSA1/START domain